MKFIKLSILLFLLISLTGCGKSKGLELSEIVSEIQKEKKFENCKIIELGDYSDISIHLKTPVISDEEYEANFNEEIDGVTDLSDKNIEDLFGYPSLEAFKQETNKSYMEHKKTLQIYDARTEVLDKIIERSKFELNSEEVVEHSKTIVYSYENLAIMYGYEDLDQYVEKELEISQDEFMENCIEEGKKQIKTFLVIGAIADKENINVERGDKLDLSYQSLENEVYSIFIQCDPDY